MTDRALATRKAPLKKSPIRLAAVAISAAFLLVGLLGFIPLFVADFEQFKLLGAESEAFLLGLFQVSAVHNLVHLAFGVAGIVLSRTAATARSFLIVGGALYAAVWLYGLFVDFYSPSNFLPVNVADNALHFLLSVVMLAAGLLLTRTGEWPTETVSVDED